MATFHSGVDSLMPFHSDTSEQAIPTPATLTAIYVASDPIEVTNYQFVNWRMYVTNAGTGPTTRVDVQWEFSNAAVPGANDWSPLQVEVITAGVSTPDTYEVQQTIGSAPLTAGWKTEVEGRWMRMLVKAGVGDPTASAIVLAALRRV